MVIHDLNTGKRLSIFDLIYEATDQPRSFDAFLITIAPEQPGGRCDFGSAVIAAALDVTADAEGRKVAALRLITSDVHGDPERCAGHALACAQVFWWDERQGFAGFEYRFAYDEADEPVCRRRSKR